MTRLISLITAAAASFGAQAAFAQPTIQAQPDQVGATFSKVYVPVGFDSNDHVQFVGEGTFNNSCFRPAPTTVAVDNTAKTIKVGPVAYEYKGVCLQVILPFDRVVDVGILAPGTWRIVGSDDKQIGQISVAPALTADPDDYLYAPVSQAYLKQSGSTTSLILNGTFPNACMSIKDVQIHELDDVIIVQPIADMSQAKCAATPTSFTKVVRMPATKAGRYLLHVRSMNGNAINTLVDIQ